MLLEYNGMEKKIIYKQCSQHLFFGDLFYVTY